MGIPSRRQLLKRLASGVFLALMFPCAMVSGFGRQPGVFSFFAHLCALVPGLVGDFVRVAYYRMTLRSCSRDCEISFGAFFAHPQAAVGRGAGIGPYCVIGRAAIGEGTRLGPNVQILSGGQQHKRDSQGRLTDEGREFVEVVIGEHCWIGASAVVLANVGDRSTVAAGAVVVKPVAAGIVVGGNPARRLDQPDTVAG
ncbi:MAG: acyltransferase [Bryobacteraceae bacterium]|jgi:virginiamycin A acetyltransferase